MDRFNKFFKNVGGGVDYIKELLQGPEREAQPVPQPRETNSFLRDNINTMELPERFSYQAPEEEVDLFKDFNLKYPDLSDRTPTNFGIEGIDETLAQMRADDEEKRRNIAEGITSPGDYNIISGKLTTEDDIDFAEGFYGFINDVTSSMIRSLGGITDSIAKGIVNTGADIIGVDRPEAKGSSIGNITRMMENISPEMGEYSRSFFGVEQGNEDVDLHSVGNEIAPLINLLPNVDIKPDSPMIPVIGGLMGALDWTTGGSGSNALRKMLSKIGKAEDLVPYIRAMSEVDVPEDEALRFANELFNNKNLSAFEIDEIIKKENASKSLINIDSKLKPKDFEKRVNERMASFGDDVVEESPDLFKESESLLDSKVISEQQFDNINKAKQVVDESDEVLGKIYDDINNAKSTGDEVLDAELKSFKETYNQAPFNELSLSDRKGIFDFMKKNADVITDAKSGALRIHNYKDMVDSGLADDFLNIADSDSINQLAKDYTGTATKAVSDVKDAFAKNDTAKMVEGIQTTTQLKNVGSGMLSVWGKMDNVGLDSTQGILTRLQKVVSKLQKEGKSADEIAKQIDSIKGSSNIDEMTDEMIDELINSNTGLSEKASDLISQYRYSNMLSNPVTHLVNTLSNLTENTIIRPAEEAIATGFEMLGMGGGKGRVATEGKAYFSAISSADNLKNAWSEVNKTFKGQSTFKLQDGARTNTTLKIGGVDLAKLYRTPLRILEAMDAGAYSLVNAGEKARLLERSNVNKITDLSPAKQSKLLREADKEAQDGIYRLTTKAEGDGVITNVFKTTAEFLNNLGDKTKGLSKIPIPFVNTISVLAKKTLRRTPVLGLLDMITSSGKIADDIPKLISEQTTGIIAMGSGYMYAKNRLDDFKFERGDGGSTSTKYSDAEGNEYNSLKAGEKWINLNDFNPIAPVFMLGAKLAQIENDFNLKGEQVDSLAEIISVATLLGSSHLKETFNNQFIGSAVDTVDFISGNSDKNAFTYWGQLLSQFSPYKSILGGLNHIYGDNRKTVSPQSIEEFTEFIFKDFIDINEDGGIGFGSEDIPQRTDRDGVPLFYGNPENADRTLSEKLLDPGNAVDFLAPGRPKTRDEDIHNKFLRAKEDEGTRDFSKEDTQHTKSEQTKQAKIYKEFIETGEVSDSDKSMMAELSPRRINQLERDYLNNSLGVYGGYLDDHFKGKLSDKGRESLGKLTDSQYQAVKEKWDSKNYSRMKEIVYIIRTRGIDSLPKNDKKWAGDIFENDSSIYYKAQNYYNKTY